MKLGAIDSSYPLWCHVYIPVQNIYLCWLSDVKLCKCVRFFKIKQEFSQCALHSFCRAISSSIESVFLA